MKSIILARVSTEEQMNEGQSIPAQLSRAREYSNNKGFIIKTEHQFDESSLKDHRKKFEEVIEEIKKSKEKVALIVETIDRLQRSFKESVLLDELRKQDKVEIHFIRENLIIHKDSNSSEIQRWDLGVFLAKSYVLQISDNVKRTNELRLKNGECIGKVPVGYINTVDEYDNKQVIVDPIRSHFIVQIFQKYSTGSMSVKAIHKEMEKLGLKGTGKNLKPLSEGMIYHVLRNPFYYGEQNIKGKLHPHKYPPLIDKELFDKCQEVRKSYHKKPFKYASKPYILRGLMKCAECGCTITPEISKGHIYYSCTNSKGFHQKRTYIAEKDLLQPILEVFNGIKLPDNKIKEIVEDLKKSREYKNKFQNDVFDNLQKEYNQIQERIEGLLDLKINNPSITNEMFNDKLKKFKEQQLDITDKMSKYTKADEKYHITANTVLNLARRSEEIFESSEPEEKRELINFLIQNPTLKGKKLDFTIKEPLDEVFSYDGSSDLLRR